MPIVAARLVLQRGDRLDEVAVELLGVAPGERSAWCDTTNLRVSPSIFANTGVLAAGRLASGQAPAKLS